MKKLLIPLILLISSDVFALNVFKNNPRTNKDDIVFATEISSTVIGLSNFASKEFLRVSTSAISGGSGITKAQGDTYYLPIVSGSVTGVYLPISSGTTISTLFDTKLSASSGSLVVPYTVMGDTLATTRAYIDTKLNASSGTSISTLINSKYDGSTIWYATSSISGIFTDSTTVNLVGLQSIVRLPFDAIRKSWYIVSDTTGSATVSISTGEITGSGLTFGGVIHTATLSTQQYETGTSDGQTIPRGYYVKFVVLTNTTSKELYPSLEVWRRQ